MKRLFIIGFYHYSNVIFSNNECISVFCILYLLNYSPNLRANAIAQLNYGWYKRQKRRPITRHVLRLKREPPFIVISEGSCPKSWSTSISCFVCEGRERVSMVIVDTTNCSILPNKKILKKVKRLRNTHILFRVQIVRFICF